MWGEFSLNKKGVKGKLILGIFALIVIVGAIYFFFFFNYTCNDIACFNAHQIKCDHTKFVNDADDARWGYKILGKDGNVCRIEVAMLQLNKGEVSLERLVGKSMICDTPLGFSSAPESDISVCHGRLKEELQQVIIEKMHSYIVDNLGDIGSSLNEVI